MPVHISKLIANDQIVATYPLSIFEDDSWVEPTVDEVLDFGESIDLPRVKVYKHFPCWFNALHEVGHWAVKPDWYIKEWKKLVKRGQANSKTPRLEDFYKNQPHSFDPTPNELGVRAWSHLVLTKKQWRYPTKCYPKEFNSGKLNNYKKEQWLEFETLDRILDDLNGFEQLEFAGIDVNRNIYRPHPEFGREITVEMRRQKESYIENKEDRILLSVFG